MLRSIFVVLLCVLFTTGVSGQEISDTTASDTMVVELDVIIQVVGQRVTPGRSPFPFEKERFNQVLTENGFGLITKGVFLAQDIQADGFKRDDITIVVDGERYHSACPNRMDSPLARSNSLEMDAIELNKTSSACCSGLGGSIAYHRQQIGDHDQIRSGVSHAAGASQASDAGFAVTTRHHRLAGRYAAGQGYTDGDGKSFVDRYGYSEDFTYRLAEVSLTGERPSVQYRGEFTYTDNVMFPYLHMDERLNRVFSGSASYRGHKLYANHTEHLMDNGLRQSMMSMTTDATNTTVGLTGPWYEAFYRRWKADNEIVTPMTSIENALMPSVNQFALSGFHDGSYRTLNYWGRVGIASFSIGDESRESFYAELHGEQPTSLTYLSGAVGAALRKNLAPGMNGVIALDVAAEPPTAQALYIAVQRPMGKAWWSGNPGLHGSRRVSARSNLETRGITFEASASHVYDYVDLAPAMAGGRPYKTYENFDARIFAVNVRTKWQYLKVAAGYTWAQRASGSQPLAEIPPLSLTYTMTSPPVGHGTLYWRHTYNDAQTRVDAGLKEAPTDSWHRFDAGLNFDITPFRINLEVGNVFDELYTQHMSYLRDPFSSGVRVYEPGRTIRANLVLLTSGE